MEFDSFQYRRLDLNDYERYIALFKSNEKLLTIKKTEEINIGMIDQLGKDLDMKEKLIIGAFIHNDLVCSASGYFPENLQYWYCHNQFSNLKFNNLTNYKLSLRIWAECMYQLMEYGEKNNYLSFYSRRSIKHQHALDTLWKKLASKGLIKNKYDSYYETIYKANQPCASRLHSFYFPDYRKTVEIDTVVCLHTLKQEYRLKLFNIDY